MGVVYLGVHGADVAAIKTVHPHLVDDEGFRQRFQREADAARLVRSSRVAGLLEADLAATPAYLALEYVAGPTMQQRVEENGPLGGDELIAFAAGLADALAAIDAAGVTHRDIKPANIISTPAGPVVIDFGIATLAEATSLTTTGLAIGSAAWMAPEQARGQRVSAACDVFAWASTVGYAASGAPPFGTGRPDAVIYRILHDAPRVVALPPPLGDLVEAALDKDPGRRPAAAQVRDALIMGSRLSPAGESGDDIVTQLLQRTWVQASVPMAEELRLTSTAHRGRGIRSAAAGLVALPILILALVLGVGMATRPSAGSGGSDLAAQSSRSGTSEDTTSMTFSLPTATVPTTVVSTTTSLATTTTTSPLRTEQIVYQPWGGGGAKDGLVIEGELSGTCWSGSSAMSGRSDAFRCMSDSVISDPCIASPFGGMDYVLCPQQGPTGPLTVLHLEEPLPANASLASSEGGSWYVELEGGTVCGFSGGATGALGDERLNYHCDDESWIIGHPEDRGDGVLQALVDADDEASARWTPVSKIWS